MNAPDWARSGVVRLIRDDSGQDLIEYALLTGIVAVAAAIVLPTATALGDVFESWNTNVQNLWEPATPGT